MKDLDTGQVSAHTDPSNKDAIRAITRELFVKLNHKENTHKVFRLDNVCYGISFTDALGVEKKASTIIRETYPHLLFIIVHFELDRYGSLGIFLLTEPFNSIFVVNDSTKTLTCNHDLTLSHVEEILKTV